MQSKKFPIFVVGFIFFIFVLNLAAMKFHWYYAIPWFDMPMHFLGGAWIAVAVLWAMGEKTPFTRILLSVLILGILWEIFELFNNRYIGTRDPFDFADTLSDLVLDVLGAGTAFYLRTKNAGHS